MGDGKLNILNFSHPLKPEYVAQIAELVGQPVEATIDVPVQFDVEAGFIEQVVQMIDGLNITPESWQNDAWLIVPPSLNYIAAVVLAEVHGRMGHFPAVIRLRPVQGTLVTTYEVAEIINLEAVRQAARTRRT
jgi:hypothetical protein